MKRFYFPFLMLFLSCYALVSLPGLALGQEKVPVKLIAQSTQNDVVGKRLTYYVTQGIQASSQLRLAGKENAIIVCEILTAKVHGRPSSAYSFIVYTNSYGKISPVQEHHIGICSNLTVREAADRILGILQNVAARFNEQAKKPGE